MDENEGIFVRFMNDSKFQTVVTSWMASEAYNRLRAGSTEAGAMPWYPESQPCHQPFDSSSRQLKSATSSAFLSSVQGRRRCVGDPQQVEDDGWEWVGFDTGHRLRPGMFVAQGSE
jgi:type I restriction enzyme R subunit